MLFNCNPRLFWDLKKIFEFSNPILLYWVAQRNKCILRNPFPYKRLWHHCHYRKHILSLKHTHNIKNQLHNKKQERLWARIVVFYYNPPASEASGEVVNITESKNPHAPVYGVKEFVCLSICDIFGRKKLPWLAPFPGGMKFATQISPQLNLLFL